MKIRLIHVRKRKSGRTARQEEIRDGARLTVGRGTDNLLDLAGLDVSLHHAVFFSAPDGVRVEAIGSGRILLNGRASAAERVAPGDVIRIGSWELRVVEPREGEWIALEVEATEGSTTELEALRARTRRGLERGLFTRRKLSLAALAVVLGLGLALPLAIERMPETPPVAPAVVKAVRSSWSSGPLSSVHGNLAQDCSTCHRGAFERVANDTCLSCHAAVGRHTRPALRMAELEEARCASCHEEHGGDPSLLALGDALCTDCHRTLGSRFLTTTLLDVDGFTHGHPEFRATVVTDAHAGAVERISLTKLPASGAIPADAPRERSGLRFPHALHLEPGLRGPGRETVQLDCGDCHRPDRSQRLMEPIRFEDHCQSCHRLAFEELDPTREVPHEIPDLVVRHVFEYYAGAALRGNIEDRAAPEFARRRPGSTLSESERGRALEWARIRAAQANDYLFEERGVCRTCHELRDGDPLPEVLPVRVLPEPDALSWMPLARFDHDPHRLMTCESCHPARESEDAGNVLLPGIDSCRECHGDVGAVREVPARCISCHDFHQSRHGAFDLATAEGTGE